MKQHLSNKYYNASKVRISYVILGFLSYTHFESPILALSDKARTYLLINLVAKCVASEINDFTWIHLMTVQMLELSVQKKSIVNCNAYSISRYNYKYKVLLLGTSYWTSISVTNQNGMFCKSFYVRLHELDIEFLPSFFAKGENNDYFMFVQNST